ncbi:hypothetical protein GCM10027047_27170 [Rhodococcus aerolatus]
MVCRTCPRDRPDSGAFAATLLPALAGASTGDRALPLRQVACVAGCPTPGSVTLDAVGKTRIRFSGLTAEDAPALVAATLAHADAVHGDPDELALPENLAARITAVTRKRHSDDP